jgi:cobalamin biosynthesis protein CobT
MPNSTAAKDTDAPVAIVSETFKNIVFSGRIDEPESEDEVLEVTVCDIHLTLCRANAYALGIPGAGLLACDYPTVEGQRMSVDVSAAGNNAVHSLYALDDVVAASDASEEVSLASTALYVFGDEAEDQDQDQDQDEDKEDEDQDKDKDEDKDNKDKDNKDKDNKDKDNKDKDKEDKDKEDKDKEDKDKEDKDKEDKDKEDKDKEDKDKEDKEDKEEVYTSSVVSAEEHAERGKETRDQQLSRQSKQLQRSLLKMESALHTMQAAVHKMLGRLHKFDDELDMQQDAE